MQVKTMIRRPLFGLFLSTFSVPVVSFSTILLGRHWTSMREPQLHKSVALHGLFLRPALNPKLRPFSCNKQILKMATTVLEFGVDTPAKAPNTGIFIVSLLDYDFGPDAITTYACCCSCFCWEERSLAKRQTFVASWRGTSYVHWTASLFGFVHSAEILQK
jgi:hypothetical protein